MSANIPQIKYNDDGSASFLVDGKEFFMLSGEVHNSVPSDMNYMEEYVWSQIKELPMNSLLVPIHWEQIEKVQELMNQVYDQMTLISGSPSRLSTERER